MEPLQGDYVVPTVSVIVTSCNRDELLAVALKSVQLQDDVAWECVVVDDASTDDAVDVAQKFASSDRRFRVVAHNERLGLSAARNTGIGVSKGKYICFLDDDDFLLKDSLKKRLEGFGSADDATCGVYCDWLNTDPHEGLERFVPTRKPISRSRVTFANSGAGVSFIATSPLLKRSVVVNAGGFDEDLSRAEDADLWFRLLKSGYEFLYSDSVGVAYRRTPGSLVTGSPRDQLTTLLSVFQRFEVPSAPGLQGPIEIDEPLSKVAVEFQRAPQILRYLAMIAVVDGAEVAVSEGNSLLSPSVRRTMLASEKLLSELRSHCLARLVIQSSDKANVENALRRLLEGLQPPISSVAAGTHKLDFVERIRSLNLAVESEFEADVILVPEADYHVAELGPLFESLQARGHSVAFMASPKTVPKALRSVGRYTDRFLKFDFTSIESSRALVVLNDWGPLREPIVKARQKGVRTFAKVEGVQDFDDLESDWSRKPYRWVEHVLAQGKNDVLALSETSTTVVGSSRLEAIWNQKVEPRGTAGLINQNFTYRVLVDDRQPWMDSVHQAITRIGVEAVVSRHPADSYKDPKFVVSSKPFRHQILSSNFLISRFSTVPFEAMARGRPFIYHNPHGERMPTFTDGGDAFWVSSCEEELAEAITEVIHYSGDYKDQCEDFFRRQIDIGSTSSADRAAEFIESFL